MPGLVPGIHVLTSVRPGVDGRDKPGHDASGTISVQTFKSDTTQPVSAASSSSGRSAMIM
ncbi:hypothetical protein FBZ96_107227 [Bradyrhizobium stylosanthis]|uniref:Uncharacterized protein n=1 Tax=Bradyrhizobium stylosanthis TaxID=1803665 RepID=A0A560DFZ6_9BRAD|nr:hypothetical protein FBZ96_107227 [Bradyrhizobium stylosanthis]